jgi:protein SCO1/2
LLASLICALLLAGALPADAQQMLRGTVLAVQASEGHVIVSGDAFNGTPAMTMSYRVTDAATLAKLHLGDRITAAVDGSSRPWTLENIRVISGANAALPPPPIRDVKELRVGDKVPQTQLLDQAIKPFTFSTFLGKNVVLAFIYTRCPDRRECPLTSAKFGQLQSMLRGRETHLVEVTLDPDYDTVSILARYAKNNGADPRRWTFATGATSDVLNFDAAFGLEPLTQPDGTLIHGEALAIIDRTGTIRNLVYTNSWSPQEIVAELDAIDNKASNPIARFDLWLSQAAVAVCGNRVAGFSGFGDLLVVLAIVVAFGWIFWRVYRAITRAMLSQ